MTVEYIDWIFFFFLKFFRVLERSLEVISPYPCAKHKCTIRILEQK